MIQGDLIRSIQGDLIRSIQGDLIRSIKGDLIRSIKGDSFPEFLEEQGLFDFRLNKPILQLLAVPL